MGGMPRRPVLAAAVTATFLIAAAAANLGQGGEADVPRPSPPPPATLPAAGEPEPSSRRVRAKRAWRPRIAAARAYARRRGGDVSFAVRRGRRSWSFHGSRRARSASTVKVMLLAAYLRAPGVRGGALGAGEAATLSAMITRSDNEAASSIHALVGDDGLTAVARRAGMRDFSAAPAWGVSRLTAADGARLMHRLRRLVPRRQRARAFALLASITPYQRWGIADAAPRGWRLHFKGGWGPPEAGAPAVNHQLALLRRGRRQVAIAILISGGAGHAHTAETQRGVAARLLRGLSEH